MPKPLVTYILDEEDDFYIVPILTTSGFVRRQKIRKENIESYQRVPGKPALRKSYRVYNQATGKYSKRAIRKDAYIFDESFRAYVKYNPDDITKIRTTTGDRVVTHEQKKHLYRRDRSGVYKAEKRSQRYKAKKKYATKGNYLRDRVQVKISVTATYEGRSIPIEKYSNAARGNVTAQDAERQAWNRVISEAIKEWGLPSDIARKRVQFTNKRVEYLDFVQR